MERERRRSSEKIISVFQANEFFVKKILSRNSSVGQQSSRYHCRMPGEVPFKWELRPGKPKDSPAKEYIPVIGPPPAVLSQALSRPHHHHHHHVPPSLPAKTTRLLFWKRSKKNNKKVKKIGSFRISENSNIEANNGFDEKFGLANYKAPADDQEFLSSSCDSTTSTSSSTSSTASSSSSSYALPVHHSKFHSLAKGLLRWPF